MHVVGGYTHEGIAEVLGISHVTLREHYRAELDGGKATIDAMATQTFVKKMLGTTTVEKRDADGNVTTESINDHKIADGDLLKFYAARRMGWKEAKQEIAHSGTIGQYDLTKLSDSELDRLETILTRAAIAGTVGGKAGEDEA